MLLAMAVATLGLSMVFSGAIASVLFDYSDVLQARIQGILPFNRTVIGCLLAIVVGLLAMEPLVYRYFASGFVLSEAGRETHWAVMGLWLVSAAFQTFIFALMIHALGIVLPKRAAPRRASE
jgi:hypothetical protein